MLADKFENFRWEFEKLSKDADRGGATWASTGWMWWGRVGGIACWGRINQ